MFMHLWKMFQMNVLSQFDLLPCILHTNKQAHLLSEKEKKKIFFWPFSFFAFNVIFVIN